MRRSKFSIWKKKKNGLKKFEKNNVTISLNVLFVKKEKIYPAHVSKHNSNREKPVILLVILNRKRWHYLAVNIYQHYYKE